MTKKLIAFGLLLNAVLLAGRFWQELPADAQEKPVATENGDLNGDGSRNVTDAVYLLRWLFQRGPAPIAIAQEGVGLTPEQEEILSHMSVVQHPVDDEGNTAKTIRFSGVNVQIVNGLGATNGFPDDPESVDPRQTITNGLGNLIVGYQDVPRLTGTRTGSHNLVVGFRHDYSSFGGLVVGRRNRIFGAYSSVSGGFGNTASGDGACVSGGFGNTASGRFSTVSGGRANVATEEASHVP